MAFLLLIVSLVHFGSVVTSDQTSCKTSSPIIEGQQASITCRIPDSVLNKEHTLSLLQHEFDNPWSSRTPAMILKCVWYPNANTPWCTSNVGYTISVDSKNTVTATIRRATDAHTGVYVCTDKHQDKSHEDAICRVYVKGSQIKCDASDLHEGESGTITCHFNSDLSKTRDGFHVYHKRTEAVRNTDEPVNIISCSWIGPDKLKLKCTPCHETYKCDQATPSNTFSIRIPVAKHHHSGTYYCDTIPGVDVVTVVPCIVKVLERTPHHSTDPPTTTTSTRPTESRKPDINSPDIVKIAVAVVVYTLAVVVFTLALAFCACYCCK